MGFTNFALGRACNAFEMFYTTSKAGRDLTTALEESGYLKLGSDGKATLKEQAVGDYWFCAVYDDMWMPREEKVEREAKER